MKIATSDQSNLILTIAEVLKDARVSLAGRIMFGNTKNLHATIRSRIGEDLDNKIAEVCGELGLIDFLRFTIARDILASGKPGKRGPLSSLEGYQDSLAVARDLVGRVENLPQKLRICSPLPKSLSTLLFVGTDDLEIGAGTRIIRSSILHEYLDTEIFSEDLRKAIVRKVDITQLPKKECHYICTWHAGFIGNFFGNHSVQEHLDKVRAFQGALLAVDVMMEDGFFDNYPQHAILVNDISSGQNGPLVYTDTVDSDINYFYENFDVSLDYYRSISEDDSEEGEGEFNEGKSDILDDSEIKLQSRAIEALKTTFGQSDHSRRLFTASLWLFRSNVSTRLLDVILESTIAIEVLLGDRDASEGLGLTNLLANRCAILLGKDASERNDSIDEFKSIYSIRSQIVHTGLHKMTKKANEASLSSRVLAKRILEKELNL